MKGDRLAKLEGQKQGETVTVVVVEDENFYGNAHLLPRKAGVGQAAGTSTEGTTSKPAGED